MFHVSNSNAIISKPKNIFAIFFRFPEFGSNLQDFEKKDESWRLFLSEIIDCNSGGGGGGGDGGYLNAQKAAYQNTYRQSTC